MKIKNNRKSTDRWLVDKIPLFILAASASTLHSGMAIAMPECSVDADAAKMKSGILSTNHRSVDFRLFLIFIIKLGGD